ncbi:MAG TPA: response regulator, partial [Ignavibacteria bacterium]
GIEKTKNNEYALILLDINLKKGISGLEVLSEIRKIPYYKDIPVIALTAFAMAGDEEEFRAGGCTDYISKPFKKEMLLEKISKALKE